MVNKDAKLIERINHREALEKQLKVMDLTAFSLAMDNQLPLAVFRLKDRGNIKRVVCGEKVGTLIK
jgi:uridylate kinase